MRSLLPLLLAALVATSLPASPADAARKPRARPAAAVPAVSGGDADLRRLVAAGKHPDLRWGGFGDVKPELEKAYAAGAWAPLWLDGARPTAAAKGLIARLAGADSLGFDPADFDAAHLERTVGSLSMKRARPTPEERARFDVALSIAAARFLAALDVGRLAPKAAHQDVHLPAPKPTPGVSFTDLRDAARQGETLARVQPPFRQYQWLKNALVRYRKLADEKPHLTTGLDLPRDLRPGDPLPSALRLRRLLEAAGDLGKHKRPKAKNDTVYSEELVDAVRTFQARHGQLPDGILFVQTIEELERPFSERARQIELALERWRWLPDFAAPPILVNVPAFRLHAYRSLDPGHHDALEMEVLVGAAVKSETPLFTADMKYLVFRPWWDLPSSIQSFELGPRAQWDWENMRKLGYVMVGSKGRYIELTPDNVARIGRGTDMRQKPGEHNALGLVKFMFPNPHDIYLHDTPAKGLFALPRRDMSHGCIRVSDPPALAEHVLRGQGDWTAERVEQAMHGKDDQRVDLKQPVPVWVHYVTVEASGEGEASFWGDIYGLDAELDQALARGFPYPAKYTPAGKDDQGRISTEVPSGTTR